MSIDQLPPRGASERQRDFAINRLIGVANGALLAENNLSDLPSPAEARVNLGVRDVLTANRTYYTLKTGNDSNNGLANTAGGAFLTIQKMLDTIGALDVSIYTAYGTVGAGTFSEQCRLKPPVGSGLVSISGAGSTTIIDPPAGVNHCFWGDQGGRWFIQNLKVQKTTATTGHGILCQNGTLITYGNIEFGALAGNGRHLYADQMGILIGNNPETITGNALYHYSAAAGGIISHVNQTITITGALTMTRFASADTGGGVRIFGNTYGGTGSVTGTRFVADGTGWINTAGGTLPGSVAGSETNGGQEY